MRTRPFLIAMIFALGSVPLFPGLEWAEQTASRYVVMTWSFKSTPPDVVYLRAGQQGVAGTRQILQIRRPGGSQSKNQVLVGREDLLWRLDGQQQILGRR